MAHAFALMKWRSDFWIDVRRFIAVSYVRLDNILSPVLR
jgi:hypothetical protein